jgi:Protein of unknown function (DUF2934)
MVTDRDREIARRAYEMWELEGRPDGRALDHWLRAEAATRNPAPAPEAITAAPAKPARQRRQTRRK